MLPAARPVPIETIHLFPVLDEKLLAFLRGLQPEEWQLQTLAPQWKVMDVALHLLGGNLQTLAMLRDEYFGVQPTDPSSHGGIVRFLNELNADWIKATRRLSPRIVLELLETTGREYTAFLQTLDPWEPATFSVGWGANLAQLVSHCPRLHRKVAPPATDTAGGRARGRRPINQRIISPIFGYLRPGTAAPLPPNSG